MSLNLKDRLYFVGARYFRFWARIALERWQPRVIVVTGSSGKTTLLNMLHAQFGDKAKVSHHANSAYGIPFNLLGLEGVGGNKLKWLQIIFLAPFRAFLYLNEESIYLAEVDAERPKEAPFLADLLRPEVTLWVSSARTHAMYYDKQVSSGKYTSVEKAVAAEYGYVCKKTTDLVMIDGDNEDMVEAVEGITAKTIKITKKADLEKYDLKKDRTEFELGSGSVYGVGQLLPEAVFYQVAMLDQLMNYLDLTPDYDFAEYIAPPGRSSIFKGKKGITIIDSAYNANLSSMSVVIDMFTKYPADNKWAVLGEMLEQGEGEQDQHEKLAELASKIDAQKIILYGKITEKYTKDTLKKLTKAEVLHFNDPKKILEYIEQNITGDETILFKGGRRQEGIIEHLLADKNDVKKLAWRADIWQKQREKLGL